MLVTGPRVGEMTAIPGDKALDLQPIVDTLSTQVCVFDQAMTVLSANAAFRAFAESVVAQTFGPDGSEAHAGAAWGLLLVAAGADAAAIRTGVEALKRGDQPCYQRDYAVRVRGKLHFFGMRMHALDLGGRRTLMLEQTDITAQKLLERRVLKAERAEGAELFASGVAHDINNLLLVISGYTDLVSRTADVNDAAAADRDEIMRAIKAASALTQQLLAMRPDGPRSSTVSVNQAIRDVARLLSKLAGDSISVELQLDADVGRIQGESLLIQQLLADLVRNARDAMARGGQVTVSTHNLVIDASSPEQVRDLPHGHWVVIRVHDTGAGMDEATLERAREPFFSTKADDDCAGLGLWVVSELVRGMRGELRIASVPGSGSTVDVYLPGLEHVPGQIFTSSLIPAGPRATILVVEDNTAVRELLQRVLRGAGYHVLVAAGPSEARDISQGSAQPIHLLLTDSAMSDMTGLTLARELKRTRSELAVVLMSGFSAQRDEPSAGMMFLEKPFTASHVLRTVEEALAGSTTPRAASVVRSAAR